MNLRALQQWYKTPPGEWLLQFEQDQVNRWLTHARGATIVQLGGLPRSFNVTKHNVQNYFFMSSHLDDVGEKSVDLLTNLEELPLQRNSVDLMLLIHTLEFSEHPTVVLKEAFDALSPNGKLLLFCFNPWSSWGLHKLFSDKQGYPWNGKYFSPSRLQHWLSMIGYSKVKDKTLCFRAPFITRPLSQLAFFVEALGQIAFPILGAVNVFLVEKRVLGTLANRSSPWKKDRVMNGGMVEPTTRIKSGYNNNEPNNKSRNFY